MKILVIRGRNLASLADEFCLDFQSEPLASAGLFAITGATGSGKSSLLDALCLALYEKTPRLVRATAQGESIPDVGEHRVGPGDPRTILRRGAVDGFAEVDFVGSDSLAYRARWSVRRARSKADGRLQQSEVTLLRLGDGQLLGDHRKSETLKLIERCIGLSFEQFTRAVLLAQNDFAAFLKASDDDRAELLQTLTGTENYSRISIQAFARAKAEGEELKLLQLQLDGQLPMTATIRALKLAELASQVQRVGAGEQRKGSIEAGLRWHLQWDQLRANQAEAGARLAAAEAAREQAAARRAQFSRIETVQPARSRCAEVGRLDREMLIGAQTLDDARRLLVQAAEGVGQQREVLAAATVRLRATEQARIDAQPALDQAKALDAQISALTPNCQAAIKARDDAKLSLAGEEARHQRLLHERGEAAAARQDAQRWLVEQGARGPLADGWQRWETLLAQALGNLGESRMVAAQGQQLGIQEGVIGQALVRAQADHRERAAQQQQAAQRLDVLGAAFAALRPDELARQRQAGEGRRDQLAGALLIWKALGEQQQRQHQCQAQQQIHGATLADCATVLASCVAARPWVERDLLNAEKSLRIAELAASESVGQLRATLAADSPCPVCGSADHPYVQHDPQLDAVLQRLRDECDRTRNTLTDLVQRESAAAARQLATQIQQTQIDRDLAAVTSAWQRGQQSWAEHPLSGELARVGAADCAAWISEQQGLVALHLAELARGESDYREATRLKDEAQQVASLALAALSDAGKVLASLQLDYQGTVLAGQSARHKLAETQQQLALCQGQLDAAFPDRLWRETWMADPQAFLAHCLVQVQEWTIHQGQSEQHSLRLTTLGASIEGALAAVAKARRYLEVQSGQCALHECDLQARQAQRNGLLQGKSVGVIEAELGAMLTQAQVELAQRQASSQQAEAEHARLDGVVRQMVGQNDTLRARREDEHRALHDWLEAFNEGRGEPAALDMDALDALLAFDLPWIERERQALQALDGVLATALAVDQAHQKASADHRVVAPDAALAEGEVAEDAAQRLGDALATTLADLEPLRADLSSLQLALAQDDERLRQTQVLQAGMERQSAKTRIWSQLNELIGSSDGKKFRNFAQQLTLDILLGYANRHLETLSRRYCLQRIKDSLGLLVVDRDMGDELRSVHSLSGGESFLLSLALALGLASLSSHRVRVESLFIDEGFGSLDADTLEVAMEALDRLQSQGRKVGVISHVQEMTERIGTRIEIRRLAGGQSTVRVAG